MRILPIFLPVQFRLVSLPVLDEFADENPSFRPVSPWMNRSAVEMQTIDAAALKSPPTTFVHDLASKLRCRKCAKTGWRPSATLL